MVVILSNMELSPDARAIVDALIDEGYAWLAGELLEQFAVGVETDVTAGDAEFQIDSDDHPIFGAMPLTYKAAGASGRLEIAKYRPVEPIPPEKQAGFATGYLRLRLVEPFRRLEDAKCIADRLVALQTGRPEGPELAIDGRRAGGGSVRFALGRGRSVDGRFDEDGKSAVEYLASTLDELAQAAVHTEREG